WPRARRPSTMSDRHVSGVWDSSFQPSVAMRIPRPAIRRTSWVALKEAGMTLLALESVLVRTQLCAHGGIALTRRLRRMMRCTEGLQVVQAMIVAGNDVIAIRRRIGATRSIFERDYALPAVASKYASSDAGPISRQTTPSI